jgi:hypothetical protein
VIDQETWLSVQFYLLNWDWKIDAHLHTILFPLSSVKLYGILYFDACYWHFALFPAEKPRIEHVVSSVASHPHPTSTRFISYEDLREATNNFEPASVLGEGGFGRVFKGVLNDGTAVAIKRLNNGGQQGDKELLVEVEMLSRLHHRNLVKLVGYYSNRDSSQNLLCYELVPNGSLEAWLHGIVISRIMGSVF